jgi:hypothetical protein
MAIDWKSFLIGHFLSSSWGFILSWILFGWVVFVPCSGGDNEQMRWESVPTRHFWINLGNKEA